MLDDGIDKGDDTILIKINIFISVIKSFENTF